MRYIKKKNTLYTISIKNLYINLYTCLYLPGLHNCKLDGEHTYIIQFEYNSIIVFHTHTRLSTSFVIVVVVHNICFCFCYCYYNYYLFNNTVYL